MQVFSVTIADCRSETTYMREIKLGELGLLRKK